MEAPIVYRYINLLLLIFEKWIWGLSLVITHTRFEIERTASKHVYYQGWNRSPVQVGCIRHVLRAAALAWPRGMGWGVRREGTSGWGTHVNPWLIHVSVWQKPLQYCKVISLQLIKINGKKIDNCKGKVKSLSHVWLFATLWTVAYQAPLSMGFSSQGYWSGLPFPSPGIFPNKASNPDLLHCGQTLYSLSHQGSPIVRVSILKALPQHLA